MTPSARSGATIRGSRILIGAAGAAIVLAAVALPAAAASPHATTAGFTVDQQRLLDTRSDAPTGPIQGFTTVPVTPDVPTGSTVELTITTTDSQGPGNIVAYSSDQNEPTTSNVNFAAGLTTSNTVVVTVPSSGVIDLDVHGAATDVVVDQQGYFTSTALATPGSQRLADSRIGQGFAQSGARTGVRTLAIPAGDTPTGSGLVALNVTAVPAAAGTGYVTVYTGGTTPATSSLNFTAGQTVTNLVFVRPAADGTVSFFVSGTAANLVVDLNGYAPAGSTFAGASTREGDSRIPIGLPKGPLQGAQTLQLKPSDVPAGTTAVVLNITSTGQTGNGYVLVYPGTTKPATSELQFAKGHDAAQTVIVPVSSSDTVTVYVADHSSQIVVDLEGTVTTG